MIRNPEQTIGKLVDNVRYGFGSFMDEPGYPETQILPQPLRRKGIREFWFEIDPAAGCFEIDFTERPASLYFIDQRFYRFGVHREVNRFATAVDRAGNHPLFADVFALFFAEISAFHAGNFDCFHSLKVV